MARPGSSNPDYNESLFPDERSTHMHDRGSSADPDEFKHTHYYNPIGWDRFDPRPHPGSSVIRPGSPIQKLKQLSPAAGVHTLHHVRDQAGNHQSIAKGSLQSKKSYAANQQAMSAPPGERLGYGDYHKGLESHAEDIHAQYFHDRRSEGRRDRPT